MTGYLARLAGFACMALVLAACTGTDTDLGVETDEKAAASAQFPAIEGSGATRTGATSQQVANEIGRVHFAPIVGAPVDKVSFLSRRLGPAATASGVVIVASGAPDTNHVIKGYFSSFSEGGQTTVIHVWDVILPSGQRVHRIQGQEKFAGEAPDSWTIVPAVTMETIADKVIADYATWRTSGA